MRNALKLAAIGEIATGLALLTVPSTVAVLLLGKALDDVAVPVARVAGLALMGLGLACWPSPPSLGMLVYSAAVAVYLACLGITGVATGFLLWPAIVLHAILTALLVGLAVRETRGSNERPTTGHGSGESAPEPE